jgi:hypothetical protein
MARETFKVRFLIVFAVSLAGCGSRSAAPPPPGRDAAPDETRPTGVTWHGSVYEGLLGPDGGSAPLAAARVCIVDHPEIACATTDTDGTYTMTVPAVDASARWAVNFTAPGHVGSTIALDGSWPTGVGLLPDDWARSTATQAGFQYPSQGTAFIRLRVGNGPGLAGATATLSPPSGVGPVYGDESGNPAPALTSTSSSGIVLFGNVTPGLFTISVTLPGRTCDCCDQGRLTGWEWTGPTPDTLVSVTAPDSITDNLYMYCY